MFSRRRSTQEPQQQSQPRTGLFRRRDTAPAVPSPSAPPSRSTPAAAADPAATLPSPPQSPPVPHTGPAAPLTAAVTQPPSHLTQLPPQAHDVPPHQPASPPQSPPLAPRQYARPPPPPPAGWHLPHQTIPTHPPPPHYRPPHVANLTELEGGTAQPNPLLPPGPDGTIMGMTSEQLEARHAAVAASPLGQLASFLDRFDPPPPPPPRQAPDARLAESMANMFISRGADPAAVRPHAGELAAAMAQATALMNTRAEEDAYARHRAAWHAANPKKGLFGTRPRTPPLPPLRAEDRADPEEYLAHMLHGGGLLQAPVPGCKYCAPMAAMRDGHARQYDEHQARLRGGREERWAVRVQSWRATYGREYDHARAAAVPDRFGNGWEYLEGGAAWDAEEARLRALEPRYSSD